VCSDRNERLSSGQRMLGALGICLGLACCLAQAEQVATGHRAVVATVHPLATDAAIAALERGGNAVDAAVAAALTLGVVDNHNSGIGGGCFILLRLADGRTVAVDGREQAPGRARPDMFVRDGRARTDLSQAGALAAGVPGALAAYALAVRQYGRLDLAQLLLPAAAIAERGFAIDRIYAGNLRRTAAALARNEAARKIFFHADGSPLRQGELLRQPDLARTYRALARHGVDWFYQGPFAERVAAWMVANGGIMTAGDLADYRAKVRPPIVTTYRGYTIVGFPPPSSGGVHVAEILNMLETFELEKIDDPVELVHIVAEAEKLAFADRAHWLGDADYVKVPRGLVDKGYARQLAGKIDRARATVVSGHGDPARWRGGWFGGHTTHIAAADAEGNWVGITATVNTSFGSKVVVPGTGVVLNNEMDDFSIQPGVPNAFGLVGARANAIEPGKRPLSSMSPTIVLKEGRPVLAVGAAGGPKIITQTLLVLVRHLDLGYSLPRALAAPRFHHQGLPGRLLVDRTFPAPWIAGLRRRGHKVESAASLAVVQAVGRSAESGLLIGVHDPHVPGKARGL